MRAAAAFTAEARMEGPKMVSRDLLPMPEACASRAGIGKPLDLRLAGKRTLGREVVNGIIPLL